MFKALEGDVAVVRKRGVFFVCELFEYDHGQLFAEISKRKFVRVTADGKTSLGDVVIEKLVTDRPLYRDRHNRLALTDGDGRKALGRPQVAALLGAPQE